MLTFQKCIAEEIISYLAYAHVAGISHMLVFAGLILSICDRRVTMTYWKTPFLYAV